MKPILKKHGEYEIQYFYPGSGTVSAECEKKRSKRIWVFFTNETGSYRIFTGAKTVEEARKVVKQHYAWVKKELNQRRIPCRNGWTGPDDGYIL